MTVKELKAELEKYPDDAEVVYWNPGDSETEAHDEDLNFISHYGGRVVLS